MTMTSQNQPNERLFGTSQSSLEDAMISAVGGRGAFQGDILGQYEVVQVRGIIVGDSIGTWQVVMKPREGKRV